MANQPHSSAAGTAASTDEPVVDGTPAASSALQNHSSPIVIPVISSPTLSFAGSPETTEYTQEFSEPPLPFGEQFGRRHGHDWPTVRPGLQHRGLSYPGDRGKTRSRSRGSGRISGVVGIITPRPVMGFRVFQKARKSEQEISATKSKRVQEFYRAQNDVLDSFAEVEEILRELREEEQAKVNALPRSSPPRSPNSLVPAAPKVVNPSLSSYGSTSGSTSDTALARTGDVVIRVSGKQINGGGDLEEDDEAAEDTPLIDYKRRQRTSPALVTLAINASFLANVFLVLIKIWTVLMSDSLAVLASMIDSLMDLLSGAIIWYSARLRSNTTDGVHYPVGKARMEPLGIIVFAAVMVTSFLQVMLQSFERLLAGSEEPPVDLGAVILLLLGLNILVKFALWAWCRTMKDSSSVQALAQDHLNDVVFNVFSTLFPVAGQFLGFWWLDALGAIVLSIYIISEWTGTCLHNIRRLTGQVATAADTQQLTYMTYRFSNMIQAIDTVRAYYVGEGLFVEIDIVLPPDTPLSQAHDLGESLQGALEKLPTVERAFVHIDYNAVHAIEHR
ncbi:hypothetical protein BGZ99_005793 [Dissophora globulifera]|uniref:Cation efflux protein cytoplasmic domain-containing protein n=1 Tax=Dissophora globulifera TaxID=979702 RepID=A0A9P6USW8_9FUNG|nr:hypothetical protein BGZ99_005793 [Dissophora globulifera]